MAVEVRLPRLSDSMTEATISRWLKSVGESVDKGEPIVEVETEKVIVEVEAPRAGVIVEIAAAEQDVVPVDGLLCRIGAPGERSIEPPRPAERQRARPAGPEPQAGGTPAALAVAATPSASNVVSMRQRAAPAPAGDRFAGATPGVIVSPLARRVAEELGIDLTGVQGTGIGGKIVMADLQPHLGGADPAGGQPPRIAPAHPEPEPPPGSAYQDVPHSALRRTVARRMAEAKRDIPHFYMTAEVDVSELLAARERLNAALAGDGGQARISVNDLMIKVATQALLRVPALNATFAEQHVRRFGAVHMGFATAIDEGLVTPVVRDCQLKTVGAIAGETRALIERARRRALTADELQGGTFTLSNLGMHEVESFAAIINPPQVGILAIARPVERPVWRDGVVVPRRLLKATLSADHRAVDGVTGARFLEAFKAVLEHPEQLML